MADDSIPKISINPALALINVSRAFQQSNNTFSRLATNAATYKLAGDSTIANTDYKISDKNVIFYTGTGNSTIVLPDPATRSKSVSPVIVVANIGVGPVTVRLQNSNTQTINNTLTSAVVHVGRSTMFVSDGNTRWFMWFSTNGGSFEAYQHQGGSALESWKFAGCCNQTALVTGAPSINVLRALPFIAPLDNPKLDRLGILVTTLTAGSARIGLYNNISNINLYPNKLLVDSGVLDTGTAGVKSVTISQLLTPGDLYWLAHVCSSTATLQCLSLANMTSILGAPAALNAVNVGVQVAFGFAALGPTFPTGGVYTTAVPIPAIGYRIS